MLYAFSLSRYRVAVNPADEGSHGATDLAVPVIDGTPLFEIVGDRYPGVAVGLVAPPSRHWLGDPAEPAYVGEDRVAVLDGECGVAGCCGVFARISLDGRVVIWSDLFARGNPELPPGLHFEFDRSTYEAAIAGVMDQQPIDWVIDYTVSGDP